MLISSIAIQGTAIAKSKTIAKEIAAPIIGQGYSIEKIISGNHLKGKDVKKSTKYKKSQKLIKKKKVKIGNKSYNFKIIKKSNPYSKNEIFSNNLMSTNTFIYNDVDNLHKEHFSVIAPCIKGYKLTFKKTKATHDEKNKNDKKVFLETVKDGSEVYKSKEIFTHKFAGAKIKKTKNTKNKIIIACTVKIKHYSQQINKIDITKEEKSTKHKNELTNRTQTYFTSYKLKCIYKRN